MKKTLFIVFGIFAAVAIAYGASFVVADSPITTVSIVNDVFSPRYITVQAGTSVLWINNDVHYHAIVSNDDYFNSGTLYSGNTFQYTFGTPGVYYYHDTSFGAYGVVTVTGNSSYYNNYNDSYAYNYNSYQNYTQPTYSNYYDSTLANQYMNRYTYANPTYSYPAQTYVGSGYNYNNYYSATTYAPPTYVNPQVVTPVYYPSSATYTQQYIYNPPALASYSYSNYPYIYPYYTTASYGNYNSNYYKPQNFNLNCTSNSYYNSNNYYGSNSSNSYNCNLTQ